MRMWQQAKKAAAWEIDDDDDRMMTGERKTAGYTAAIIFRMNERKKEGFLAFVSAPGTAQKQT